MKKLAGIAAYYILLVVLIIGGTLAVFYKASPFLDPTQPSTPVSDSTVSTSVVTLSKAIPNEVLTNKFGFSTGYPGTEEEIAKLGARWVRPHTGPFVWGLMQKRENDQIDFSSTDYFVRAAQDGGLGTLVTLFPYADWDQKKRENSDECRVDSEDIFSPKGRMGPDDFYLPFYRCNPTDWEGYASWVRAVVERYDGDGVDDMPGLEIPIKYWEIINEPDLTGPSNTDMRPTESLTFYMEGPPEFAILLKRSYQYVKEADSSAHVLIAGAAGGGNHFLDFYREVFKDVDARDAFDIGNVHCISNDSFDSYNVEPYKKMLLEFGIDKPIWVTEAAAHVHPTMEQNIQQAYESTAKAIDLGAERLFYTGFDFGTGAEHKEPFIEDMKKKDPNFIKEEFMKEPERKMDMTEGKPWIKDSLEAYKELFSQY